jgi:uncharacterized protein (DUF433 family)
LAQVPKVDEPCISCDDENMPVEAIYPHIVKELGQPARLDGHARTRVAMIVTDYLWRGWSAEEIALKYPYLTPAEVHAAMAYYFDHREEIDQELAAEYRDVETWKEAHPTSPLLLRLKQQDHG